MHLLTVWSQYVDIIYMPAHEIEMMKLKKKDPTLFATNEGGIGASMRKAAQDKEYMTVEEGFTTDTAESEIEEVQQMNTQQDDTESEENDFEGGILGSLLEEENNDVTSFEPVDMDPEEIKEKYGFEDGDITHFSKKLESERDFGVGSKISGMNSGYLIEEIDAAREEIERRHNVQVSSTEDIFGFETVNADEASENKTRADIKNYLKKELKKLALQENQFVQNFEKKQPMTSFDPYNPGFTQEIIEDDKQRISLFMDAYKRKLQTFDDSQFTANDKALKEHLINMTDYISKIRIIDAKVLLNIFDTYKFKTY